MLSTSQTSYKWGVWVLLQCRIIAKAPTISMAYRKGRENGKRLVVTLVSQQISPVFILRDDSLTCKVKGPWRPGARASAYLEFAHHLAI